MLRKSAITFLGIMLTMYSFGQMIGDTIISNDSAKLKLKVLYFHITNRCNTCRSIEAAVRKTINNYFKTELDSGTIDLYVLNCELPENKDIAKKYDAYGATLAFTSYKNGVELKSEDYTNWAFQKIDSPEIFISELKDKITEFLK